MYEEHAAWLAQPHAWAVLPETMAIITAVGRGEISLEAARERNDRRAALRQAPAASAPGAVAVLTLRGLVTPRGTIIDELCGGGGGLETFQANLSEAVASDDVASILIDIDSPGGLVDLVPETAALIREARGVKPVVAISNTLSASAAYWLASQADEIVVTPSGFVGSIGVYMAHEDWSGHQEKTGRKTTLVSAGRFKTEGNPFEPLSDEARAAMQSEVDELYDMFVEDVAAGRGVAAQVVRTGYGEGRVLTARRAVSAGLADRIATADEVIAEMVQGAGTAARPVRGAVSPNRVRGALDLPPAPPASDPAEDPADDDTDPEGTPPPGDDETGTGSSEETEPHEDDAAAAAATTREERERLLGLLG